MKCANCSNDALFIYQTDSVGPIPYCNDDLPGFLRPQVAAGLLQTTDAYDQKAEELRERLAVQTEKPKRTRKPKAEAPVDPVEPVVDDADVEPIDPVDPEVESKEE